MQGKIIKGIAGFYYVHIPESGVYVCKAKGIFRKQDKKPLAGDVVEIQVTDELDMEGNIVEIFPRKNQLIRPPVANIDQAMVIFAAASPTPNFNLLDRFLISMQRNSVPVVICFNKRDLITQEDEERLFQIYHKCGCRILFTTTKKGQNMEAVRSVLNAKTTALAGPSGVGKSSIINCLHPELKVEVGEISRKIEQGKHTTRHTELICISEHTYIMDTPGFGSLLVEDMEKEEVKEYFEEFEEYAPHCRFNGCMHLGEPACAVKEAVDEGEISRSRYLNYRRIYEEIKDRRRY